MAVGNYVVSEVRTKDLQVALRALDTAGKVVQAVVQVSTGRVAIVSHD